MAIKFVALDVYGTMISSRYGHLSARKGLENLFGYASDNNIKLVTSSDTDDDTIRGDLLDARVNIGIFSRTFELKIYPKEFNIITDCYKLKTDELLVVGDTYEADIQGAIDNNSRYIHVWKYQESADRDKFDFSWVINAIQRADSLPGLNLSSLAVRN